MALRKIPVKRSPYVSPLVVIDNATFVIGTEATNVINVSVQLKNASAANLAVRGHVDAYFSDDANGDSIVATAPDGAVVIGTNGMLFDVGAVKKMFKLTSEANGLIDINITHSLGKTLYLIVVLPDGRLKPSAAITFA